MNSRGALLENATNATLRDVINQLYRSNARIGSGSAMDALRYELKTGELLSPKGHALKLIERRTQLMNLRGDPSLNTVDQGIIHGLLVDIQNALSGF